MFRASSTDIIGLFVSPFFDFFWFLTAETSAGFGKRNMRGGMSPLDGVLGIVNSIDMNMV